MTHQYSPINYQTTLFPYNGMNGMNEMNKLRERDRYYLTHLNKTDVANVNPQNYLGGWTSSSLRPMHVKYFGCNDDCLSHNVYKPPVNYEQFGVTCPSDNLSLKCERGRRVHSRLYTPPNYKYSKKIK